MTLQRQDIDGFNDDPFTIDSLWTSTAASMERARRNIQAPPTSEGGIEGIMREQIAAKTRGGVPRRSITGEIPTGR